MTPPNDRPGTQAMAALTGVRILLREIQALLAEVSQQLDRAGWERATRSQRISHLNNRWDRPQDWMPRYLFRWFRTDAHPDVLLVLIVHLEEVDQVPPEPWVVLGAYRNHPNLPYAGVPLDDRNAETYAAGLHIEGEEPTASGTVLRQSLDGGERLSVAVNLFDMDGPDTIAQALLSPLMEALMDASRAG